MVAAEDSIVLCSDRQGWLQRYRSKKAGNSTCGRPRCGVSNYTLVRGTKRQRGHLLQKGKDAYSLDEVHVRHVKVHVQGPRVA